MFDVVEQEDEYSFVFWNGMVFDGGGVCGPQGGVRDSLRFWGWDLEEEECFQDLEGQDGHCGSNNRSGVHCHWRASRSACFLQRGYKVLVSLWSGGERRLAVIAFEYTARNRMAGTIDKTKRCEGEILEIDCWIGINY